MTGDASTLIIQLVLLISLLFSLPGFIGGVRELSSFRSGLKEQVTRLTVVCATMGNRMRSLARSLIQGHKHCKLPTGALAISLFSLRLTRGHGVIFAETLAREVLPA